MIRYNFTKDGNKADNFWCDNAGLQLPVAPYYMSLNSDVKAKVGNGYVEISFATDTTFSNGELTLQTRLSQSDWSNYVNFEEGELEVFYN